MSTIFSDPGWRRGSTLLNREVVEFDDAPTNSIPTAGKELVGQVKIFQDVDPSSGRRFSNRLVYCVAARYTGTADIPVADAGKVFAFSTAGSAKGTDLTGGPLEEFSAYATATNVNTDLRYYGVLDEYLTEPVRKNDIVWLVVKGPCSIQSGGTAIAAGAPIEVTGTGGRIATRSTGKHIASQIAGASVGGTAGALVRANLHSDLI